MLLPSSAIAAESVPAPAKDAPHVKPYPLSTCIVSGDAFDAEPGETVTKVYDGSEIRFCCQDCVPKYEKDPAAYNKKLDEAEKQQPAKPAPGTAPAVGDGHGQQL